MSYTKLMELLKSRGQIREVSLQSCGRPFDPTLVWVDEPVAVGAKPKVLNGATLDVWGSE